MSAPEQLEVLYLAQADPIVDGWTSFRPILDRVLALGPGLAPDCMLVEGEPQPLDPQLVSARLDDGADELSLGSSDDPWISYRWESLSSISSVGMRFTVAIPLARVSEPEQAERLITCLRDLATLCPPIYGWAHPQRDRELMEDPCALDEEAEKHVYEAYWLTILGTAMVDEIGRARVTATPASRVITVDGAVFILTRPTPADVLSEEARAAQADVLAHLRDDVSREEALERLRHRSKQTAPVERDWDPDLIELLEHTLAFVDPADRRSREIELNEYRPPEVSEWRPASQALPADIGEEEVDRYCDLAEEFVMGMHSKIPELAEGAEDPFLAIDRHFWAHDHARRRQRSRDVDEILMPGLGAYLGQAMIELGGRWVPRRSLEEAQVILGARAYLPFLRVKHYLQSKQSVIDHSLTKFMREAARRLA